MRCHLRFLTGRAGERLSFDVQKPLAAFFYAEPNAVHKGDEKAGMKPVEKFMRRYFLVAENIGDLTIFVGVAGGSANQTARLGVCNLVSTAKTSLWIYAGRRSLANGACRLF